MGFDVFWEVAAKLLMVSSSLALNEIAEDGFLTSATCGGPSFVLGFTLDFERVGFIL